MLKYKTVECEGYWEDEPDNIFSVTVALGEWDEVEDAEDEKIFFYMDGEPLKVGAIIADNFVVTEIESSV